MVIGPKILLKLVKEKNLVDKLDKRELETPEGAGFDLRLGAVHKISGGAAFLGISDRETPTIETLLTYEKSKKQELKIKPSEFYLLQTIEEINLPLDITAQILPRTTTFRCGLILRTGPVQPGYQGSLTFACFNAGPLPVVLELGCRFAHIQFFWVDGEGEQYRGQWQGGRVTTDKREKQV
jgi:deoxycytidine triphosphate deaminase